MARMARAGARNEMRELLGKLHLHCFGPSGVAKEAAPQMSRTVLMAGWLFQKARTGALERAAAQPAQRLVAPQHQD